MLKQARMAAKDASNITQNNTQNTPIVTTTTTVFEPSIHTLNILNVLNTANKSLNTQPPQTVVAAAGVKEKGGK